MAHRPLLIAFTGLKGSGKSTAANYLKEGDFVVVKFVAPLKDMLRALGATERQVEGDLKEVASDLFCGQTPRHAMQTLGTEWGRNCIGNNFWLNLWSLRVRHWLESDVSVVNDDLRFRNEYAAVKSLGGIVVRIIGRNDAYETDMHPSEREIHTLPYDYYIENRGTIPELYNEVDALAARLRGV